MTTVTSLREPLKSFIEALDKFELTTRDGRVCSCGWGLTGMPDLDPEEARFLVRELNAVMLPIIHRFRDRKLAEFMTPAQTMPDSTFRSLVDHR